MFNAVVLVCLVTAYAPNSMWSESAQMNIRSRGINGGKYTASGLYISESIAACGPRWFGYVVEFDNVVRLCADRGGAISNNRVDIAYTLGTNDSRIAQAKQWGVRRRIVQFHSRENWLKSKGVKPAVTQRQQFLQVLRVINPPFKRCIKQC